MQFIAQELQRRGPATSDGGVTPAAGANPPTEQGFHRRVGRLAALSNPRARCFASRRIRSPDCAGRFDDKARRAVAGLGAGLDKRVGRPV
jgi:hypothetical protein